MGEKTTKGVRGKNVLLTGASSGIGRATALALAREGARLAIVSRRREALEKLADEIAALGFTRPVVLTADLAVRGAAAALADAALAALGTVDVLVNNAGIGIAGAQLDVGDADAARRLFETNYWSPVALASALGRHMAARGTGVIVNVTSLASVASFPLTGHYASSKAALAMANETLRAELAGTGVHVLHVAPGPVDTGMLAELDAIEQEQGALRWLPRGNADVLARKIVRGIARRSSLVAYPTVLGIAFILPTVARFFLRLLGGSRKLPEIGVVEGGTTGDPRAAEARRRFEARAEAR